MTVVKLGLVGSSAEMACAQAWVGSAHPVPRDGGDLRAHAVTRQVRDDVGAHVAS